MARYSSSCGKSIELVSTIVVFWRIRENLPTHQRPFICRLPFNIVCLESERDGQLRTIVLAISSRARQPRKNGDTLPTLTKEEEEEEEEEEERRRKKKEEEEEVAREVSFFFLVSPDHLGRVEAGREKNGRFHALRGFLACLLEGLLANAYMIAVGSQGLPSRR